MTFDEIQAVLTKWVADQTALPVIWMFPNVKRPNTAYIGLTILSSLKYGVTEHLPSDNDGNVTLRTLQSLILSIHVFMGFDNTNINGAGICSTLLRSLSKESVIEYFNTNNLSINVGNAVTNYVPEIKGTQFEQRWVIDVPVYFMESDIDLVGLIENAEYDGTFSDGMNSFEEKQEV